MPNEFPIRDKINTKAHQIRVGILACAGLFSLAAAQLSQAATMDQLETLESSWPDAEIAITLDAADPDGNAVIGEDIRYNLTGNRAGSCYLLHLDSHGSATLLKPDGCGSLDAAVGQFATTFPASGGLEVAAPLGMERVFGFLVDGQLPQSDQLLDQEGSFAPLATQADFDVFVNEISNAASSRKLAVTQLAYRVDADADALQFTTRGIVRKVVEGTSSKQDDGKNFVAAFDVQSIQFEFGSAELTESSRRQLDAFGAAMQDDKLDGIQLQVAGHTDDIGEAAFNQSLSEKRAAAVKSYISNTYKIPEELLDTAGMGEAEPLVPNTTDENRALNRRVEMKFFVE